VVVLPYVSLIYPFRQGPGGRSELRDFWMHTYPPTSMTRTSASPDSSSTDFPSNAAPLALFVGPERKHLTGYWAAVLALLKVPSFIVIYKLHFPNFCTACENPAITCRANLRRLALRMAAFSRSMKPIRPVTWEQETSKPGPNASARTFFASSSCLGLDGEYTPMTTMLLMDFALIIPACCLSCSTLKSDIGSPSTRKISY
jgi:hypothetical protein